MARSGIRRGFALLAALVWFVSSPCLAQDLRRAAIVAPVASGPQAAAVAMLASEVRARTGLVWRIVRRAPIAVPVLIVGRVGQIATLLPPHLHLALSGGAPEGFTVKALEIDRRPVVVIAGNDTRGVLYGVGYLLRKLETAPGFAALDGSIDITTAPAQPVRGVQIGYRAKNNSYDAWTVAMFTQRVRDLAIFGANTIQVISPQSDDDASSPLFPAPPLQTLIGIGRAAHRYGLDFDLYYPEMAGDYGAPGAVLGELKQFEALVRRLPRIDALYIPGGDPGRTAPGALFPLVAQEAAILRRHNPRAKVWISAQGFDKAQYEQFYALLAREPAWLSGVFFGPQSRDPLPVQRRRIPTRYPIQLYPDTAHTMHAQFPVPRWDEAFAVTEGREPIDPRPVAETAIFRALAPLDAGFVAYSEGVTDDVNTALWFQLGWSPNLDPHLTIEDYARAFLGARFGAISSDRFADAVFALERNWVGPPQANPSIDDTLQAIDALDAAASPRQRTDWRFESVLYRAVYDAYVRRRALAEGARETAALAALAEAPKVGAAAAIAAADHALASPDTAVVGALRARLFDLAGRLYAHAGLQLSVKRYGASGVERGANLDRVDVSLNDRVWLTRQFAEISNLPSEAQRLAALAAIVDWPDRRDGALYDDLGDPAHEPHLVRGLGFDRDPELYDTAIDGVADVTPDDGWRRSWISYAETLYASPLTLAYTGLDPRRAYRVRITYAGEGYHVPVRLVANGAWELQPPTDRASNPTSTTLDIPRAATAGGALTLQWFGPPAGGGSGRGHQVAEVWLIPDRSRK